jgi:transcriptional regulator with XRE-family HTH domain
MPDLKTVIAQNIIHFRKAMRWTQAELAQKLNYSDKAVSKWERAEATPDVAVLKDMADLFQVPVNVLLEEAQPNKEHRNFAALLRQLKKRNHIIIALVSAAGVFFIATVLFVISGLFSVSICQPSWMLYIYAIPLAIVVLLVFNAVWGKPKVNLIIISALIWSVLLAIYLSFSAPNIWLVFMIGIPAQIIVLLLAPIKPVKLGMFHSKQK